MTKTISRFSILLLALLGACLPMPQNGTETPVLTNTPEIPPTIDFGTALPQKTPFTPVPTETETSTWTPLAYTATASVTISPTYSPLPPLTPSPSQITTQAQLQTCVNRSGAICPITGIIRLTSQLTISASDITILGGEITNAPEYPNRLVAVIRAGDVTLSNVTIYGTVANAKSSVKDCLLILESARVVLQNVTLAYCEDELLDITRSTASISDSILAYPLFCAMHLKGCHAMNTLCIESECTFTRVLFAAAKERLPKCEHSRCMVTDSLYYDIDGQGLNAAGESIITFTGNMLLTGPDTDAPSYAIVAGNADEYPIDPLITEKCTLVINPIPNSAGILYPRVRRYGGDRVLYTNPVTNTPLLSDTTNCTMPKASEYWVRLEGVGADSAKSEVIRQSVRDGTGIITSVPLES